MMNIDVRQPLSRERLARLYSGNAEEADRDMRFNAPQGYGYVQEQARNMGISDPATYFGHQQLAQQMASTPSGGLMEARRISGNHSPDSLPGQLAARDSMWNGVMEAEQKQATQLASLQTSQRMSMPLPSGTTPMIPGSPMADQERFDKGYSRDQWAIQQRLGPQLSRMLSLGGQQDTGQQFKKNIAFNRGVAPSDLARNKNFQGMLQQHPTQANEAFQAVTGQDYLKYTAGQEATRGARGKEMTSYFNKGMQEGLFKWDKGKILQRERVVDPNTGKLGLGANYGQLDDYGQGLVGEFGMDSIISEGMQRLMADEAARKARDGAAAGTRSNGITRRATPRIQPLVPEVFSTAKFAALQKTNPEVANTLWRNLMQDRRIPPVRERSIWAEQTDNTNFPF